MREKTLRTVVTFRTTTDAMAMETYCASRGVAGRLIPTPSIISAGCGLCWSAPAEEKAGVLAAAEAAGIERAGVYEMLL